MAKKNPAIIKRGQKTDWEKSNYIPDENVIIIMDVILWIIKLL